MMCQPLGDSAALGVLVKMALTRAPPEGSWEPPGASDHALKATEQEFSCGSELGLFRLLQELALGRVCRNLLPPLR